MSDRDSKLIFENYKKEVLLNEGWGAILAGILPIVGYAGAKTGITDKVIKRLEQKGIDIDAFLNSLGGTAIRFLDPTGVTSWPALQEAENAYKQNPNDENAVKWWNEFIMIIPAVGSMYKKILGTVGTFFRGAALLQFCKRIIYYASKNKQFQSMTRIGIRQWVKNYKKYKVPGEKSKEFNKNLEHILMYLVVIFGRSSLMFLNDFTGVPAEIYDYIEQTLSSAPEQENANANNASGETSASQSQSTAAAANDNIEEFSISRDNGGVQGGFVPGDKIEIDGKPRKVVP